MQFCIPTNVQKHQREREREREREGEKDSGENSKSKGIFYKDCSLGSVKNQKQQLTTSPC